MSLSRKHRFLPPLAAALWLLLLGLSLAEQDSREMKPVFKGNANAVFSVVPTAKYNDHSQSSTMQTTAMMMTRDQMNNVLADELGPGGERLSKEAFLHSPSKPSNFKFKAGFRFQERPHIIGGDPQLESLPPPPSMSFSGTQSEASPSSGPSLFNSASSQSPSSSSSSWSSGNSGSSIMPQSNQPSSVSVPSSYSASSYSPPSSGLVPSSSSSSSSNNFGSSSTSNWSPSNSASDFGRPSPAPPSSSSSSSSANDGLTAASSLIPATAVMPSAPAMPNNGFDPSMGGGSAALNPAAPSFLSAGASQSSDPSSRAQSILGPQNSADSMSSPFSPMSPTAQGSGASSTGAGAGAASAPNFSVPGASNVQVDGKVTTITRVNDHPTITNPDGSTYQMGGETPKPAKSSGKRRGRRKPKRNLDDELMEAYNPFMEQQKKTADWKPGDGDDLGAHHSSKGRDDDPLDLFPDLAKIHKIQSPPTTAQWNGPRSYSGETLIANNGLTPELPAFSDILRQSGPPPIFQSPNVQTQVGFHSGMPAPSGMPTGPLATFAPQQLQWPTPYAPQQQQQLQQQQQQGNSMASWTNSGGYGSSSPSFTPSYASPPAAQYQHFDFASNGSPIGASPAAGAPSENFRFRQMSSWSAQSPMSGSGPLPTNLGSYGQWRNAPQQMSNNPANWPVSVIPPVEFFRSPTDPGLY